MHQGVKTFFLLKELQNTLTKEQGEMCQVAAGTQDRTSGVLFAALTMTSCATLTLLNHNEDKNIYSPLLVPR